MKTAVASVPNRIMKRARAGGRGGVFTPGDFLDMAGRAAVDQALSRLVKGGKLRRLARGLYDFPKVHPKLGRLSPTPDGDLHSSPSPAAPRARSMDKVALLDRADRSALDRRRKGRGG